MFFTFAMPILGANYGLWENMKEKWLFITLMTR